MLTVEPFICNGETSEDLAAIKLQRKSLHPGVMSDFISEKAKIQCYVRGTFSHIWVVTKEDAKAFLAYLQTFKSEALTAYFKQLRKAYPKSEAAADKAADIAEAAQNALAQEGAGFTLDLKDFGATAVVPKTPTPAEGVPTVSPTEATVPATNPAAPEVEAKKDGGEEQIF